MVVHLVVFLLLLFDFELLVIFFIITAIIPSKFLTWVLHLLIYTLVNLLIKQSSFQSEQPKYLLLQVLSACR